MGELKDPDTDSAIVPAALIGTQYLPSLRGVFWSDDLKQKRLEIDAQKKNANDAGFVDNTGHYHILDPDLQRAIKRTKIGVQLLEKKSDPKSKFDLFQRLNSGGLSANDQELRNCAIVMVNKNFFERMKDFAEGDEFSKLIPLGPTSIRKSNHLDNLSKIISFSFVDYKIGTDIEEFVTNSMVDIASRDQEEINNIFDKIQEGFKILVDSCGYGALRPYRDGEFVGRIGRTSIEIILVGILRCLDNIKSKQDPSGFVKAQIIAFWQSDESKKFSAAGIAGTDRVQFTIPRGIALFSE